MLLIPSVCVAILAVIGIVLFRIPVLFCIFALILSIAGAAALFMPFVKKRTVRELIDAAFLVAGVCLLVFSKPASVENPLSEGHKSLEEIAAYVKSDPEKAGETLEKWAEEHEESDDYFNLSARRYIALKQPEEAISNCRNISYENPLRYTLAAEAYAMKTQLFPDEYGESEYYDDLRYLYEEAVDRLPGWAAGQAAMGAIVYETEKNPQAATYYLAGAISIDPKNVIALYYMGVICYDMGNLDYAASYFSMAIESGASEAMKQHIAEYAFMIRKAVNAE